MFEALLYEKNGVNNSVLCKLCSHYCEIKSGNYGNCGVRQNIGGELFSLSYGNSSGFAIDPIEKKPLYHFKPGTKVLSFGTQGCNFHCSNCQNWQLSQEKCKSLNIEKNYSPDYIASLALKYEFDGIAYTYSEPTIFFEYARDTILKFREFYPQKNYFHIFVSNGFMSKETLDFIEKEELISAINIDLKFMDDSGYKKITGGNLKPVLENIKRLNEMNEFIHLEITNLLLPNENDSKDDIKHLVDFIANLNNEIPLHISRFYPNYRMKDKEATGIDKLLLAKEIAESAGLKYIYIGNTGLEKVSNTFCPNCNELLIKRNNYNIKFENMNLSKKQCKKCETKINLIL